MGFCASRAGQSTMPCLHKALFVSTHFMTTAERVKTRRKELKRFLLMDDKRNDIY